MKKTTMLPFILLIIIVFTLPSICYSESKTVQGEYCDIYLGNLKDKKELEDFRKLVRRISIKDGVEKLPLTYQTSMKLFTQGCWNDVISNYLEKVVVVSHTEKGRKVCDKVKVILDPEIIVEYFSQEGCKWIDPFEGVSRYWYLDVEKVLTKNSSKINIGLIIDTKIKDIDKNKKEQLEDEQEEQFHEMVESNKDNMQKAGIEPPEYKVVDRRHLSKVIEEQKLSSSGITKSETIKLGEILNLDIIVLRVLYDGSETTKVLKTDTGEVLLFKTYKRDKKIIFR